MTKRKSPDRRPSTKIAFILALIPGLGQIYAGKRDRGRLVMFFVPSMLVLTLWRMSAGGVNYSGTAAFGPSEAEVRAAWGMGIFLLVCTALVYLWSIWDAVQIARGHPLPMRSILLLGTLAVFVIGWDVTQISFEKALSNFSNVLPYMSKLLWPWPEAFVRGVEQTQASAQIDVPCGETLPEVPPEVPGTPYIEVSPRCGEMAGEVQPNGTRNPPGTVLHITGRGFRPNEPVQAWWEPPASSEFRPRASGSFVLVQTDDKGSFSAEITIPNFNLADAKSARSKLSFRQEQAQGPLRPSQNLLLAVEKMIETIFLALMATFFGSILAVPLSFLAARNLMSGNAVLFAIYSVVRGVLNTIRSIDPLIWAMIAVTWVGLGPFAGTLALTLHTIASNGKLYSESIESIEPGPIEAIQATGANWLQVIVYAIIPQIIPPFVSFTVYRWDVNIRSSTIIGAVGGGGIGLLLRQWINLADYSSAGIAVWLIALVVWVLDYTSSRIREEFV
jgi:phosphonate transport system permease protein